MSTKQAKMKAGRICKLRIDEVSLVDAGDNPGAEVTILKRRETDTPVLKQRFAALAEDIAEINEFAAEAVEAGADPAQIEKGLDMKTLDEINTRLGEIEGELETVTKNLETVTGERDAATAKVAELEAALEKAKEGKTPETDEDDVLKDLPADHPIRKRLENAEAQAKGAVEAIEKANDERAELASIEKVRGLGTLVDAQIEPVGQLLHRIAKGKGSQEDADKVFEILKTAAKVNEKGEALFKAIGDAGQDNGTDKSDAEKQLEEGISNLQKAKPTLTREQAYDEVLQANPALYDELAKIRPAA